MAIIINVPTKYTAEWTMSLEIITATEKAIAIIPQITNKISSICLFLLTHVTGNSINFPDYIS